MEKVNFLRAFYGKRQEGKKPLTSPSGDFSFLSSPHPSCLRCHAIFIHWASGMHSCATWGVKESQKQPMWNSPDGTVLESDFYLFFFFLLLFPFFFVKSWEPCWSLGTVSAARCHLKFAVNTRAGGRKSTMQYLTARGPCDPPHTFNFLITKRI